MPTWEQMTADERKAFLAEAADRRHAREYEDAKALTGIDGPKWSELTEQQRQNIRAENARYAAEMQNLGELIKKASGT